jgi:secreted Zn-dependent insulinase-like peptidase
MRSGPFRCLIPVISALCLLSTAVPLQANEIITSPNDKRQYENFSLENGLQVLVISDPSTDKAAASLDVSVGSGNDPTSRPGLAHFLEHMLFLGTKKFPKAGAYQTYISEHGGMHNAFTAHDRTNYFFDVEQSALEPALDRFSRFFIDPLFSSEYVQREMHAVHSEYQSGLKDDRRRKFSAFRAILNPKHPYSKFSVGSLDTLSDHPGKPIRDELIRFYERYYSANLMSLVVLGSEPIEELKALVTERFSAIPNHNAKHPPVKAPLFREGSLPAQLNIASLKDIRQLSLDFPVPPIRKHYRNKPLRYLGALLGHEGKGSLLSLLKQEKLATRLSAGTGLDTHEQATFSIRIGLTESGLEQPERVAQLVFKHIELIRAQGIQPWIFAEEKVISDTAFRFKEPMKPIYYASRLAGNLKEYPAQDLLRGDYLYQTFDAELIRHYLDHLNPNNLLLTLTTQKADTDRTDPWYGTPFRLQPLNPAWLKAWQQSALHPDLKIPEPNPFLTENFDIKSPGAPTAPVLLLEKNGLNLWYQQDTEFRTPKADFYFSLRSPIANDSARHHLLSALYIRLVNDELNEALYPAAVAGLGYSLYPHQRGFSGRISGYNAKQSLLVEKVARTLRSYRVDKERFDLIRADLERELKNSKRDRPYNQTLREVRLQLFSPQWSVDEQLQELTSITADELQAFLPRLFERGEAVILAHGNLLEQEALEMTTIIERTLMNGVKPMAVADSLVQLLEQDTPLIKLALDHNDAAITLYLQGEDNSFDNRAGFALLTQVLATPFYNELRTEKQLGYLVSAFNMPLLEHPGIALVVQSPVAPPAELQRHIRQFLTDSRARVANLDKGDLERHRESVLVKLLKREQTLKERSNRFWREIDRGHTQFDSREQLAEAIRQVDKKALITLFDQLLKRQLVVQAAGNRPATAESTVQ